MEFRSKNKIIVILGPTSSGKSDLAIQIAKKFNGEIISADSRQVYRGMDIGSGKVLRDPSRKNPNNKSIFFSNDIRHHMLDIVSPKTDYNVSKYKKQAQKIIGDILLRNKLPIVCGGTGFWIKALVDDIDFPEVKPDWKLRAKLEKHSAEKLFSMLKKLDATRAKNIDQKNKVRLIGAIEICKAIGKVPPIENRKSPARARGMRPREIENRKFLQIGIDIPQEKLNKKIAARLKKRFAAGLIAEVETLHFKNKLSWKRLESFGLEYRSIAHYLQKKISQKEMQEEILQENKNYAKRQLTWFRKDKRIKWLKKQKGSSHLD